MPQWHMQKLEVIGRLEIKSLQYVSDRIWILNEIFKVKSVPCKQTNSTQDYITIFQMYMESIIFITILQKHFFVELNLQAWY